MSQFYKDPEAVLDYSHDWTDWLAGDSISTSEWEVPSTLTKVTEQTSGPVTTVWLASGARGSTAKVVNHVTTAGGRTDERTIYIKVKDR